MNVNRVDCSKIGGHIIRQYEERQTVPSWQENYKSSIYKYYCEKCGATLEEIRSKARK